MNNAVCHYFKLEVQISNANTIKYIIQLKFKILICYHGSNVILHSSSNSYYDKQVHSKWHKVLSTV